MILRFTPRLLAAIAVLAVAAAQDDPGQTGPTTLVIEYRCYPAQRAQLRQAMVQTGLPRLQHWREEGMLSAYRVLFSRYADTNNWDMLTLMTFQSYAESVKWKRIERSAPSGMTHDVLSLTIAVNTYPVDLLRSNAAKDRAIEPVYLVIPYTRSTSPQDYAAYAEGYLKPQLDASIEEGILSRYDLFTQRFAASRPWDSLLLLEYKDDDSFGARDRVRAKIRATMRNDPGWRAFDDRKQEIRREREAVIADLISPP